MSWVLRESEAKLGNRLVLLVLADHAKDDGTCAWPSTETIASEARLSVRQVKRCLDRLEEDGEITLTGFSKAGTQVWTIAGYPGKGDNKSPRRARKGVTSTTNGADRMSPEPSLEQPSEEPSAAAPRNGHPPRRTKAEINAVWEALSVVFGEPETRTAQTGRGKVVQSLCAAGATPDEIFARCKRWAMHFDHATMTDHALEKHWHTLPLKPRRIAR
jgi:hypothetical protein